LIVALLRLGKKYDCPVFRKDCIRRVKMEFPTTSLAEYDKISGSWDFIQGTDDTSLHLLSLAREIGLHSILPLLYNAILVNHLPTLLDSKDARLSSLDRSVCLLGYLNLLKLQSTTTLDWLNVDVENPHIPSTTCSHPDKCVAVVKKIVFTLSKKQPQRLFILSRVFFRQKQWEDLLCASCYDKADKIKDVGRAICWEQLPAAFGLPDWEELKSLDFE
ncbi:hypothetical protein C8F04DRAFT_952320, partial [Mycena alexandri]